MFGFCLLRNSSFFFLLYVHMLLFETINYFNFCKKCLSNQAMNAVLYALNAFTGLNLYLKSTRTDSKT